MTQLQTARRNLKVTRPALALAYAVDAVEGLVERSSVMDCPIASVELLDDDAGQMRLPQSDLIGEQIALVVEFRIS